MRNVARDRLPVRPDDDHDLASRCVVIVVIVVLVVIVVRIPRDVQTVNTTESGESGVDSFARQPCRAAGSIPRLHMDLKTSGVKWLEFGQVFRTRLRPRSAEERERS